MTVSTLRPLSQAEVCFITTVLERFDHQCCSSAKENPDFEITTHVAEQEETEKHLRSSILQMPASIQAITFNHALNLKHWVNITQLFELHLVEEKYRSERIKAINESAQFFITKKFKVPVNPKRNPVEQLSGLIFAKVWQHSKREKKFEILVAFDNAQLDIARRLNNLKGLLFLRHICKKIWDHKATKQIINVFDCRIGKIAIAILTAVIFIKFWLVAVSYAKAICIFPLNKALAFGKFEGVIQTICSIWQNQLKTFLISNCVVPIALGCCFRIPVIWKGIIILCRFTILPVEICFFVVMKIGKVFFQTIPIHYFQNSIRSLIRELPSIPSYIVYPVIREFGPLFQNFRWEKIDSDWTKLMSHSVA